MSYCNLRDYPAAEAAYTQGITIDPGYAALYALRSEVRLRQGDRRGALEDGVKVRQSALSNSFGPMMEAGLRGDWTCETFFTYDYSTLGTESGQ